MEINYYENSLIVGSQYISAYGKPLIFFNQEVADFLSKLGYEVKKAHWRHEEGFILSPSSIIELEELYANL